MLAQVCGAETPILKPFVICADHMQKRFKQKHIPRKDTVLAFCKYYYKDA